MTEIETPPAILKRPGKPDLAYRLISPSPQSSEKPYLMFCGGYRSDMTGTKAKYFEEQCRVRGQGYVRFDYSGHGASGGAFEDGTIGSWLEDVLAIIDGIIPGPVILAGSSMGGWLSLLAGLRRPDRVRALIGIAAAPDFTEEIYQARLTDGQRQILIEKGIVSVPNDYSDTPYSFTKAIYEDGRKHLLLNARHNPEFPIHLFQGQKDKDVPWQTAEKIRQAFGEDEVNVTLIEDGDHSLSRPEDLKKINAAILRFF